MLRFKLRPTASIEPAVFWRVEIRGTNARIYEASGRSEKLVADFHERDSRSYLLPPSFWDNRAKFCLILGSMIAEVEASPKGEQAMRDLIDRAIVHESPNAATRTIVSGAVQVGLGFGLAAVALFVTAQSQRDGAGGGVVWWGGIMMGAIWGCWGLSLITRFPRLRRLAKEIASATEHETDEPFSPWSG